MPLKLASPTLTRLRSPDVSQMQPVGELSMTERQFITLLLDLLGGDCRLLWLPLASDTTTNTTRENATGRVMTYDATVAARLASLGRAIAQTFNGSANYGTTPDTTNLTFGTGAADLPCSIVVLANVTDTAAVRVLVSKFTTSNREYQLFVDATDKLSLLLQDESAAVAASRLSDAAITQASWRLFGASYDGTGGTTAANGITLYQDGAVIPSTPSNNASYVAMENLAAAFEIGSNTAHAANFFSGSLALATVCAKALVPAEHAAINALCKRYFNAP